MFKIDVCGYLDYWVWCKIDLISILRLFFIVINIKYFAWVL